MNESTKRAIVLMARGGIYRDYAEALRSMWCHIEITDLIEQLKRHQLDNLFLTHYEAGVIPSVPADLISDVSRVCAKKVESSRCLDEGLSEICEAFRIRSVDYAVLKGPVLAHSVYPDRHMRTYSDIDILVKRDDCKTVSKMLSGLGYVQGRIVAGGSEIRPASKRELTWCVLYNHHLFPFIKLAGGVQLTVEVHTDLSPIDMKRGVRLFATDKAIGGWLYGGCRTFHLGTTTARALSWESMLVHLCIHCYTDEMSAVRIAGGGGAVLRAYCDIRQLLESKGTEMDLGAFAEQVRGCSAARAVYFILSHLVEVYPDLSDLVAPVLDEMPSERAEVLDEFGLPWQMATSRLGRFSRPFMERIFDDSGKEDFKTQSHLFDIPEWELELFNMHV